MTATFVLVAVLQQLGRTYRATLSTFEAHIGHNLPALAQSVQLL
jgi:hypothetical protein